MLVSDLEHTKKNIRVNLIEKGLFDNWSANLLNRIEPATSLEIYCHKCKTLSKIDFIPADAQFMYHCNSCDIDIMDLYTELSNLIVFNIMKKKEGLK